MIVSTWAGPSGGNWNVAGNWLPPGVPNNGGGNTYEVIISVNSPVNLNITAVIDTLTLGPTGQLTTANGTLFGLAGGLLLNDGLLLVNSGGATTDFRLDANTSFSTPFDGAVQFSNTQANRLYANNAAFRLTNDANHTIMGSCQLGVNQMLLTNDGLIHASSSGNMVIDLAGGGNFNAGVIRADGGNINFINTAIDNTGGVFEALNAFNIDLTGTTSIVGGTLHSNGGLVRNLGTTTLQDVSIPTNFTANNGTLTLLVGTIDLGTLNINSGGATTDLRVETTPFSLDGGAEVAFSNTQANRFYGGVAANRLIIPSDAIVHGSCQLGVNQLTLTNDGLIDADASSGMAIDLGGGSHFNAGVIRASGGNLVILNSALDNTGGLIEAINGFNVDFSGINSIFAGTLHADAGSLMRNLGTMTLENVSLDSTFTVNNGTLTMLRGAIDNAGSIVVNSSGATTDLRIDTTPFSLDGGGEVVFSNTQANRLYGGVAANRLIIPADATVRGAFQLGVNQMALTNDGLIVADASGGITIDLPGGDHFNMGVIRALAGHVTIANSVLNNALGVIQATNGFNVDFSGTNTVMAGELHAESGGLFRNLGTLTLQDGIAINAPLVVNNGTLTLLRDTIFNNGSMTINSSGATTDVRGETNPTIISGAGEMVFSNTQANRLYGAVAANRIINDVGHVIRGAFQLGVNQVAFTNHGAILADVSSGITIDVAGAPQDFINSSSGLLHASAGNIAINAGPFINQGTVLIDAGRTLTRSGEYSQTAGTTTVNGSLVLNTSGAINLSGGTLKGGTISGGPVNNTAGIVEPGASAGTLALTGNYTQGNAGTLRIEIGGITAGTEYDRLAVTGNVSLDGALEIVLINGFRPAPGQTFTILTNTGTRTGTFCVVNPKNAYELIETSGSIAIALNRFSCQGDVNNNGVVDVNDLLAVVGAWGSCACLSCQADISPPPNGNGFVDVNDLLAVVGAWGNCP